MRTEKQVIASRQNGKKGKGPNDTTTTRWSALRHGLCAKNLTELDDADAYQHIVADLTRQRNPVGPVEENLVQFAALDMVRWGRAQLMEAEFIATRLRPATHEKDIDANPLSQSGGRMLDPEGTATISLDAFQYLLLYQRYEAFFCNRFYRTLHELERIQRLRQGEYVPAPCAADVTLHTRVEEVKAGAQETPASNLAISVNDKPIDTAPAESKQPGVCDGGIPEIPVSVSAGSNCNPGMTSSVQGIPWQKATPRPIWDRLRNEPKA